MPGSRPLFHSPSTPRIRAPLCFVATRTPSPSPTNTQPPPPSPFPAPPTSPRVSSPTGTPTRPFSTAWRARHFPTTTPAPPASEPRYASSRRGLPPHAQRTPSRPRHLLFRLRRAVRASHRLPELQQGPFRQRGGPGTSRRGHPPPRSACLSHQSHRRRG